MSFTVHLNIGTNKSGLRHTRLREALAALSVFSGRRGVRMFVSAPMRSAPWGYDSPNEFINMGVRLDFPGELTPERALKLLDELRAIEKGICPAPHRNPDGSYRDREIDIDIITAGALRMTHPRLQLPHPRAHQRPFVLEPMRELGGLGDAGGLGGLG